MHGQRWHQAKKKKKIIKKLIIIVHLEEFSIHLVFAGNMVCFAPKEEMFGFMLCRLLYCWFPRRIASTGVLPEGVPVNKRT